LIASLVTGKSGAESEEEMAALALALVFSDNLVLWSEAVEITAVCAGLGSLLDRGRSNEMRQ
jgi:hypothetical protein